MGTASDGEVVEQLQGEQLGGHGRSEVTAQPLLGTTLMLASSLLIFSGAAQFAMIGLLAAGVAPAAVLWTVGVLALRHLPLGALMRRRVEDLPVAQRAGLAWSSSTRPQAWRCSVRTRSPAPWLGAGTACYTTWVAGTALGLAGASLSDLEPLAAAVFPVLFIALASLTAASRDAAARTLAAGLLVVTLLKAWPGFGGLAPLVAAVVVALRGARR